MSNPFTRAVLRAFSIAMLLFCVLDLTACGSQPAAPETTAPAITTVPTTEPPETTPAA